MKHLRRNVAAGLLALHSLSAQAQPAGNPPPAAAPPLPETAAPVQEPAPAAPPAAARARPVRLGELPALLGVPVALPLEAVLGRDLTPGQAAAPSTNANANANANAHGLSLEAAISKGVANSLEVQAGDARRESFEYTAAAARGALLPRVDARAATGTGRLTSLDPSEQRHRKEGNVTLKQPLFDVPAFTEYQRQGVLAASSAIELQGSKSGVSLDVASAYLQVTQATLNLELSRGYEKQLLDLLEYINQRAKAGGASNAERDRVRARVANVRSGIADAKANQRSLLRNFQSLVGEAPDTLLVQAPDWLRIPVLVREARDEAERLNHELLAARSAVEASGIERNTSRARMLPRVELEVSHSHALNAAGTPSYTKDTKAMVALSWSVLNGGTDYYQARAAAARTREKQLRADEARRKLWQELDSAYFNLDAVAERYASLREELLANGAVVEAFRAQLVGGNRSLLDVLDALQRLHQSRLDIVQMALGELNNQVKVAHLTGRLAASLGAPR